MTKLIILDRDGVINVNSNGHVKQPSEWVAIPGSIAAIAKLTAAKWSVAVATNQSGIARGLFDKLTLQSIHDKMKTAVANRGGRIDFLAWCPHEPADKCTCRKPKTGLYRLIASHFGCSLQGVPVIGDSRRDLVAAETVGARPILVKTGNGLITAATGNLPRETKVYRDLATAVKHLLLEDLKFPTA